MLKNLLDDPSTADKLKGLFGGVSAPPAEQPPAIDPAMLLKISKAMKQLNSAGADKRAQLLCDLKPYISPARARRVDEAVNILKIFRVAEIIQKEREDD